MEWLELRNHIDAGLKQEKMSRQQEDVELELVKDGEKDLTRRI